MKKHAASINANKATLIPIINQRLLIDRVNLVTIDVGGRVEYDCRSCRGEEIIDYPLIPLSLGNVTVVGDSA